MLPELIIKEISENGIYLDIPSRNASSGYKAVLDMLSNYYSPILSGQEYHLSREAQQYHDRSGRPTWKHELEDASNPSSRNLGDIVIKHLGSYERRTSVDRNRGRNMDYAVSSTFAPGETRQKYWLFFNLADEFSSKNERDRFMFFFSDREL